MIREPAIFIQMLKDELMGTVANKAIITELFNWMNLAQLLNVRKVQFFFFSNGCFSDFLSINLCKISFTRQPIVMNEHGNVLNYEHILNKFDR